VLISSSKLELEHEDDSTMIGAAWALVSAMCYAIYLGMFSLTLGPLGISGPNVTARSSLMDLEERK